MLRTCILRETRMLPETKISQTRLPTIYPGADKSLARAGRKQGHVCQNGVNFLRRLALQGGGTLKTSRVSMLLKSRASLTCFRACFLPGRAKDLSAPRNIYESFLYVHISSMRYVKRKETCCHCCCYYYYYYYYYYH